MHLSLIFFSLVALADLKPVLTVYQTDKMNPKEAIGWLTAAANVEVVECEDLRVCKVNFSYVPVVNGKSFPMKSGTGFAYSGLLRSHFPKAMTGHSSSEVGCGSCSSKNDTLTVAQRTSEVVNQRVTMAKPPSRNICGYFDSPHIENLGAISVSFEVVDRICKPDLLGCGETAVPIRMRQAQLVNFMRTRHTSRRTNDCNNLKTKFEESCNIWSDKDIDGRIEALRTIVQKVLKNPPLTGMDERISESLIMCIIKREDPWYNPAKLSNRACSHNGSDYGFGQILRGTVSDYWRFHKLPNSKDARIQELFARYSVPQNIYDTLGDDPELQVQWMVLIMDEKFHGKTLDGMLRSYDNNGKNNYLNVIKNCMREFESKHAPNKLQSPAQNSYLRGGFK